MTVPGAWYLTLAAILFMVGAVGLLVRRNVLVMFMCVELMLNAVNLTFVTFARMLDDIGGPGVVFFTLGMAAGAGGGCPGPTVLVFPPPHGVPAPDGRPPLGEGRAARPST